MLLQDHSRAARPRRCLRVRAGQGGRRRSFAPRRKAVRREVRRRAIRPAVRGRKRLPGWPSSGRVARRSTGPIQRPGRRMARGDSWPFLLGTRGCVFEVSGKRPVGGHVPRFREGRPALGTPVAKLHEHNAAGEQLVVGQPVFVSRRLVVDRPPLDAAVGGLGGERSATTSCEQASSVRQAGQRTLARK